MSTESSYYPLKTIFIGKSSLVTKCVQANIVKLKESLALVMFEDLDLWHSRQCLPLAEYYHELTDTEGTQEKTEPVPLIHPAFSLLGNTLSSMNIW